jgi:hypothetical protein
MVGGVKAKLMMLIVLPEVDAVVVDVLVFDVEQLVKPTSNAIARIKTIMCTLFFFIFLPLKNGGSMPICR